MIASKHQNHLSSENIENPLSFVSIKNSGKKAFILWLLYYIVLPFYTSETLENNKFLLFSGYLKRQQWAVMA